MKIRSDINYTILNDQVDNNFLKEFESFQVISDLNYIELKDKIMLCNESQLVFNNTFYNLNNKELEDIISLLNMKSIKFINITSNVEETLLGDYILVYDKDNLVLEGNKKDVLKEEKILKKIGYGLPFIVDLSTQLQFYNVVDKTYYAISSLVGDLWN